MALTRHTKLSGGQNQGKKIKRIARSRPPASEKRAEVAEQPTEDFGWAADISDAEWGFYVRAMNAVRAAGVEFMLGGGFAQATFTGRWRNTKDIDFYILPRDRERAVEALSQAGFKDYHSRLPYDRKWIYRSVQADMIVDIIWAMANQRAQVDEIWLERAHTISLRGEQLKVVPIEEFMWCKLYILQRDRCDWIDIFNVLYAAGIRINWDHFIQRLEDDTPLLQALLTVYGWLHPERASQLPQSLWDRLGLPTPDPSTGRHWRERVHLLDSRAWFAALRSRGERLEI